MEFFIKLKYIRAKPDSMYSMYLDSMYTNIDIEDCLEAVRRAFTSQPDSFRFDEHWAHSKITALKNNDFEFNKQRFLEIALSYANIFMADWKVGALEKCHQQPTIYFQYRDDIYVWSGTTEKQTWNSEQSPSSHQANS